MKNPLFKKFIPVIILFVFFASMILILKSWLKENGFDTNFLLVSNAVLFALTFLGFVVQSKGVHSSNIHAFIRGIYSSLIIKMFVIIAAVFIYIYITDGKVNKPALFTSMLFYLIYTSVEVSQLMKLVRRKTNA